MRIQQGWEGMKAKTAQGQRRTGSDLAFLRSWETYLVIGIVGLAGFLRLYRIDSSTLDADQTMLYRMARDAVQYGHLIATSNASSIGNTNPPGAIYLLLLPALFTADPLWGTIWLSILATLSVLLTYLFVRRYYGWQAACLSALLYASAHRPVAYARYIWQPNLMPFFVMLFIWLLFRGVVEQRKGWLVFALPLAGFIFQLHTTAVLLLVPLALALLLAPGTIRKRDIALGLLGFLLVYAPYIFWEFSVGFKDLLTLAGSGTGARFDDQALRWYRLYISPYDSTRPDANTVLASLQGFLTWIYPVLQFLLALGMVFALIIGIGLWSRLESNKLARFQGEDIERTSGKLGWLRLWWGGLRGSPYRGGLLLLLTWQIIPLLAYTRHTLPIYRHYLLFTLPGQFILIGLLLTLLVRWLGRQRGNLRPGRFFIVALASLLIMAQTMGSLAADIDQARGNYQDIYVGRFYYSDIGSMHTVLHRALELAQQRHIGRLFVTTDITENGMGYLSEQLPLSVTTFDDAHCMVLPSTNSGAAIMVVGPHSTMTRTLLANFASATLLEESRHRGGPPYSLYLINPDSQPRVPQEGFPGNLQLVDTHAQRIALEKELYLVTRWSFQRLGIASYRKSYTYNMLAPALESGEDGAHCTFNSIRSGDHLLVAVPTNGDVPASLLIKAQYYEMTPHLFKLGPFVFETAQMDRTPRTYVKSRDGKDEVAIPSNP